MCHTIKMLKKNSFGNISICKDCGVYNISFTNIYLELPEQELVFFRDYISKIDVDYREYKYSSVPIKRKIVVLTTQKNISLLFDKTEFNAFKDLVFYDKSKTNKNLSVFDIDYTLLLN